MSSTQKIHEEYIDEEDFNVDNLDLALHEAILDEDIERVTELLKNGADADSCDDEGNTALYNACKTNNYELVELIIEYGEINDNGDTCTALSATNDESIIDLLFSYGALREFDYYCDFRYYANYEMVFGFDNAFRDEVILNMLKYHEKDLDNLTIDEEELKESDDEIFCDLRVLGVKSIHNGKLNVNYETNSCNTYDLNDLFEKLGYDVAYEGSNNKLEGQTGIYFVR